MFFPNVSLWESRLGQLSHNLFAIFFSKNGQNIQKTSLFVFSLQGLEKISTTIKKAQNILGKTKQDLERTKRAIQSTVSGKAVNCFFCQLQASANLAPVPAHLDLKTSNVALKYEMHLQNTN